MEATSTHSARPLRARTSMTILANSMKMHKAVLSEVTSEASRRFKVRNRYQSGHGWNYKNKK